MKKVFLTVLSVVIAALCMFANASDSQFKLKKLLKEAGKEVGKEVKKEWKAAGATSTETSTSWTSSSSSTRRDDGRLKATSEIEGLEIKVKSCTADENDNVIIVFTLENLNKRDAECDFRPSEAYDDEGNHYSGDAIRFAPSNEQFSQNCVAKLPSGIPTKYRMRIKDVDPAASMLKKVKIAFYELPIGSMTGCVNIVNLPIKRVGDE